MRNKQLVDEIRHVVPLTLEIDEPHSADASNLAKIYELLWGRVHPDSKVGTLLPRSPAEHLEEARYQIRMAEKLLLGAELDELEEPAESPQLTALHESWDSILECARDWNYHASHIMNRVEVLRVEDGVLTIRVVPPHLMKGPHIRLLDAAIEAVTGMDFKIEVEGREAPTGPGKS